MRAFALERSAGGGSERSCRFHRGSVEEEEEEEADDEDANDEHAATRGEANGESESPLMFLSSSWTSKSLRADVYVHI